MTRRARHVPHQPHNRPTSHPTRSDVEELLGGLTDNDPRTRELAAARIGDWLIAACRSGSEVTLAVNALVEALAHEADPTVQEEIAHALSNLVEYGTVPNEIIEPLQQRLPHLDPPAAEQVADVLEAATWPKAGQRDPSNASESEGSGVAG